MKRNYVCRGLFGLWTCGFLLVVSVSFCACAGVRNIVVPEGGQKDVATIFADRTCVVGNTLPYTVLIDDEGKIVAKGLLGDDLGDAVSSLTKKTHKSK